MVEESTPPERNARGHVRDHAHLDRITQQRIKGGNGFFSEPSNGFSTPRRIASSTDQYECGGGMQCIFEEVSVTLSQAAAF